MSERKVRKGFTILPLLLLGVGLWLAWRSYFVWMPAPPSVERAVSQWLVQEAERYYIGQQSLDADTVVASVDGIEPPLFHGIRMKGDDAGAVLRVSQRFPGPVPRYARKKNRVRFFTLRKSAANRWKVDEEAGPLDYYLRFF